MDNQEQQIPSPEIGLWRYLPILNANQGRLSVFRGVRITIAATGIGLVAGGWAGGSGGKAWLDPP